VPSPDIQVLQIVGYKNSGKTTLLCALVRRFRADGFTVAAIKHDAHDFEIDRPGTDTRKMAEAGADFVAITSPRRTAWIAARPASLDELIGHAAHADLVLVEGFKDAPHPKLVLLRGEADLPLLGLPNALAAIVPSEAGWMPHAPGMPVYRLDDVEGLYAFVRALLT
jgi:molybdopterin-guanine dinucleotide biosynthesis protein B